MNPVGDWKPRSTPDHVEQWIAASTRNGVTTFRNASSALWATIAIVGISVMCMVLLGPDIMVDVDPMGGHEVAATATGCFLITLLAYLILVRTRVRVANGFVTVLNPFCIHEFTLEPTLQLSPGGLGFPRLRAGRKTVYLLAMETTDPDGMSGDYIALERMIETAGSVEEGASCYRRRVGPPDAGLVVLLASWSVYAARFLI